MTTIAPTPVTVPASTAPLSAPSTAGAVAAPTPSAAPAPLDSFSTSSSTAADVSSPPVDSAPVDTALAADVLALRTQANLQGNAPAQSESSKGAWQDAKNTACLLLNAQFGDAVCSFDVEPAVKKAIDENPELGKPTLTPTEAAELVGKGLDPMIPDWMRKLAPKADISDFMREGQTYENGYKDWFKKDAETGEWQRYVGPEDGKGFPALSVPPGEGIPVSADEDVASWKPHQ